MKVLSIKLLYDILEDLIAKWATRYKFFSGLGAKLVASGDRATVNFSPWSDRLVNKKLRKFNHRRKTFKVSF